MSAGNWACCISLQRNNINVMSKIVWTKTWKYKYNKKLKKFVPFWGVSDDIKKLSIYPGLAKLESRLQTFYLWPLEYIVSGKAMAAAGFFYKGNSDIVTCFCWGGQLFKCDPFDNDPCKKHANYFPSCKCINFKKGKKYDWMWKWIEMQSLLRRKSGYTFLQVFATVCLCILFEKIHNVSIM